MTLTLIADDRCFQSAPGQYSYRDLLTRAEYAAQQLSASPLHRWAIYSNDIVEFIVFMLAALKTDKELIVLPNNRPAFVEEIAGNAEGFLGQFDLSADTPWLQLADIPANSNTSINTLELPLTQKLTFFTSGSTGKPQRIDKQFRQLINETRVLNETWGDQAVGCKVIATVSHQHIYGMLFKLLWPLTFQRPVNGNTIQFTEELVAACHNESDCLLISSPAHLDRFITDPDLELCRQRFRFIFSSGAPLSTATSLAVREQLQCPVTEVYGSTETGGIGWRQQLPGQQVPWRLFSAVQSQLAESGCLMVKSAYLVDDNWFETSDLAVFTADREFVLQGRVDRIVKIEGKRLSLDELTAVIKKHSYVADAHAIVLQRKRANVSMVVALNHDGLAQLKQLGKFKFGQLLRSFLSDYFEQVVLPRRWRFVETLPRNSQGKLVRQDMEKLFESDS